MKKKKVLIIDTSHIVCFTIGRILEDYSLETFELSNADYLIENSQEFCDISLIILDCSMVMLDGSRVLDKIKANNVLNHIPVLVLACYRDEEYIQMALRNGAIGFIRKPFSEQDIVVQVNYVLGPSDNNKVLYSAIRKEVNRAERGNHHFSLIRICVPENMHLAKYERIVSKLREAVREIDTVYVDRTLGIIVVLPFTKATAVPIVAKRILSVLVQAECLETSFTYVTFPQDGIDENALINKINTQLVSGRGQYSSIAIDFSTN